MLNRTIAPSFRPVTNINLPEAETILLANGSSLYAINWGEQPVMSIDLFFEAGYWHNVAPALSFLTLRLIQEGTNKRSSKEIAEFVAGYGAYLELSHNADRVNVTLHCLTRFLPVLAPFLHELINNANFPERELEVQKNILTQQLHQNQARTSYLAAKAFKEAMFGQSHPYGYSLLEEDINAVTQEQLLGSYNLNYKQGPLQIIVAGKIGDAEYKIIDDIFGSRPYYPAMAKGIFNNTSVGNKSILVPRKDAKQSSIRVGRTLFNRENPDYFKARLLSEVLGGYFGSRLMRNIREDKGYTYGIYSQIAPLQETGYFVISADVSVEHTQDALDEIAKEIKILQTELVPAEELETVRNYMLGTFANSLNSPFALADRFKAVHFSGLDYSYYHRLLNSIRTITAEELLETANKYLNPSDLTEVVAGDK